MKAAEQAVESARVNAPRPFLPPIDTPSLTEGERQVLKLAAKNASIAEIAASLKISIHTVRNRMFAIREKSRDACNQACAGRRL